MTDLEFFARQLAIFVLCLAAVHFGYWFLIVPFHSRRARRLGINYDPVKNEYYRGVVKR